MLTAAFLVLCLAGAGAIGEEPLDATPALASSSIAVGKDVDDAGKETEATADGEDTDGKDQDADGDMGGDSDADAGEESGEVDDADLDDTAEEETDDSSDDAVRDSD